MHVKYPYWALVSPRNEPLDSSIYQTFGIEGVYFSADWNVHGIELPEESAKI